jgi:7-carboxy-7-deazaguanine synthase
MAVQHLKLANLNGEPEIFYSIQGEGRQIGRPSVFVRTSLCNLHCVWCDTDYTWNWEGTPFHHVRDADPGYRKFDKKQWLARVPIEEVADRIAAFPCRNVVLTGGEPMMQQAGLVLLMRALLHRNSGYWFEVETNATYKPDQAFDCLVNQYNASPKLSGSGNPDRLREKPGALRLLASSPKAFFKFVVASRTDLEEVLSMVRRYRLQADRVWLMPEGATVEELAARRAWLVEHCKAEGFHYTDRLHIQIWGSKKGV